MYFSGDAIKNAYSFLFQIEPRDEGKSRQEKVSALRYLLATSIMLKKLATPNFPVGKSNPENRRDFIESVGQIVKINASRKYSVNFSGNFAEGRDFGVGSNFLTTIVKGTRGGRSENYPGRPKPVLKIDNESISILNNIKKVLEDYYNLAEIRAPLAIWSLRAEDIRPLDPMNRDPVDELRKSIAESLAVKFEPSVADAIRPTKDELSHFLANSALQVNQLFASTPADQAIVLSLTYSQSSSSPPALSEINQIVTRCYSDLTSAGLMVRNELVHRFISSLLAKRFLILTGLSGSGKTKLAQAFATWISVSDDQYRLVAVGADWTTNENIVGYPDALQPGVYRKPSNGALDLIIRANANFEESKSDGGVPALPYFLILDEMNLSHVERYFADILSAIESGQEIALHSGADQLRSDDDSLLVPRAIKLPENLFVIGTVNIDETTYMFSPKVLDRANVIEFRPTAEDMASFLDAPEKTDMGALESMGVEFGQKFVEEADSDAELTEEDIAALKEKLTEIFGKLAEIGAEFGFRTAYEIARFVHFHKKLSNDTWKFEDALDAQVMQKLMPKLHGSERKLGPVLEALDTFCKENQCKKSREKVDRMQSRMKTDGFTSFAEA